MKIPHIFLFFFVVGCGTSSMRSDPPPREPPVQGRAPGAEEQRGVGEVGGEGLEARLEGYNYPYQVSFFEVRAQRQELEMAYMDVRPAAANGRSVMLLHGKNFSGAYWGDTIARLVELGYRVVVPDQIGFGKSSKPVCFQYSFEVLASLTEGLLEHLGVDEVSVVGHSMGGMLATRFALMYPERTRGLALINPIGLEDWARKGVPYRTIDAWYERNLKTGPQDIKEYMRTSYFAGEWKEAYDPLLAIQAGWARGPDTEQMAWISALTYDMIYTQPVVHEFPDLRVPTLLIIGQRDRTALGKDAVPDSVAKTLGDYPELGERAARLIPRAKLVEIEGVGHIPQVEAFARSIEALTEFLASLPESKALPPAGPAGRSAP